MRSRPLAIQSTEMKTQGSNARYALRCWLQAAARICGIHTRRSGRVQCRHLIGVPYVSLHQGFRLSCRFLYVPNPTMDRWLGDYNSLSQLERLPQRRLRQKMRRHDDVYALGYSAPKSCQPRQKWRRLLALTVFGQTVIAGISTAASSTNSMFMILFMRIFLIEPPPVSAVAHLPLNSFGRAPVPSTRVALR